MSKIDKLAPEQEKQLIEFREECLKIGLSTKPIKRDIKEHKEIVDYIYKNYLNLPSPVIWYVDSPLMLNLLINLVFKDLEKQNLEQNLEQNLGQNLMQNLEQNLWQNLGQFENVWYGNNDICWLCFYIFPEKYLGIRYDDFQITSLNYFYQLCGKIGWIWYFKNICFISDRPVEIHKKGILLHNETKPAMLFRDGYCLWCLNGINVPRWLVETRNEDLDIQKFFELKNAEVRREFIRKFGVERIKKFGETKDKKRDYELIDMSKTMLSNRYSPYLLMRNPSIGTFHLEGVVRECKTVEQALNWRNGLKKWEEPLILT